MSKEYKYEVAFSLTDKNRELARQINNQIKNKMSTYVYFENLKETGGQDGLKFFPEIFSSESRLVVILYDSDWGKTDWTKKEELAIRNRIVKDGWEFILLVKLDKNIAIPSFYPNPYIWIDYSDVGSTGVASVIEYRVKQLEGIINIETIEQKAQRINEEKLNIQKIQETLSKEYIGINFANDEVKLLFNLINEKVQNISSIAKELYFRIVSEDYKSIQINALNYILNINWWTESINSLDGAHLDLDIKERRPNITYTENDFFDIYKKSYEFGINESWVKGWHFGKEFFTSQQIMDQMIEFVLNKIQSKNKIK